LKEGIIGEQWHRSGWCGSGLWKRSSWRGSGCSGSAPCVGAPRCPWNIGLLPSRPLHLSFLEFGGEFFKKILPHVSPHCQSGFPRQSPLLLFIPFLLLTLKLLKNIIPRQATPKDFDPCNRSNIPPGRPRSCLRTVAMAFNMGASLRVGYNTE
jgi:hypothetical protein